MNTVELSMLQTSGRITIDASPAAAYDLIADVTRMGELSPVTKSCRWDDGAGPSVGSWFTGHNVLPDRDWERRCEVIVADPGREFAWMPGGAGEGIVRWGYTFTRKDGGTDVEESWAILQLAPFFLEQTDEWLRDFVASTRRSIDKTLVALKRVAESA